MLYFQPEHIEILSKAVVMAEDILTDAFSLTHEYWKKNPFEVKTLKDVDYRGEIQGIFAHLAKYGTRLEDKKSGGQAYCLYRIVLIDPEILKATGGNMQILTPFFLYIITHELLHILRFSFFKCGIFQEDKTQEEAHVHALTNELLMPVKLARMGEVIDFFKGKQRLNPNIKEVKKCQFMNISANPAVS